MATASLSTVLLSTKLLTFTEEERNVKFEYMIDFERRYMYTLDELEIFSKVNKSIMGGRPSQNLLATKKFDFFESRSGDLSYTDETFPRWMTMVKSFNVLDRTQQFIYHSPVRNFV